jgi:hypothetical protein
MDAREINFGPYLHANKKRTNLLLPLQKSHPLTIPPSATTVVTLTHLQLRTDYTPEAHTALELQRTTARI